MAKLNLRDTVSEGRLLRLGGHVGGADEEVDTDGAVVDLDAVQGCSGLLSLLGPVEDDGRTSQTLAVRAVLHEDLLGPADTDSRGKVFLQGVLVVVTG